MKYQIIPCRIEHLREIARTMRAADRAEIEDLGYKPRHVLHQLWRDSMEPRAAIVGEDVAAVWGDAAPLLAPVGSMWLFTSPAVERVPLAYVREVRRDVRERLKYRETLRAHVSCDYTRSLRFWAMLGFSIGEPIWSGSLSYREIRIGKAA